MLSVLGESANVSQRELLERLHIRSASLSELLIKLEKKRCHCPAAQRKG
ncbi:MAG: hypothetical protein LBI68_02525 [Azoarcus sp.]|nr:hypothetical protein [Azoarcus sp.]